MTPRCAIENSIVAGNLDHKSPSNLGTPNDLVPDPDSTLTINYSLIGVADGLVITGNTGNLTGTVASPLDPLLGPLADNGGPTRTQALLPGSPAFNVGWSTAVSDQRGLTRDVDGVDMGAYEAQIAPSADFNSDGRVDGRDFLAWQRGFGKADAQRADGNSDDDTDVDASDLAAWRVSYGQTTTAVSPAGSGESAGEQPVLATQEEQAPAETSEPVATKVLARADLRAALVDAAVVVSLTIASQRAADFLPEQMRDAVEELDLSFISNHAFPVTTPPTESSSVTDEAPSAPASEPWLADELLGRVFDDALQVFG